MITAKLLEIIHAHKNVSDIHVRVDEPVLMRSPDGYTEFGSDVVTSSDIEQFIAQPSIGGSSWNDKLHAHGGKLSGAVNLTDSRVRFSIYEAGGDKRQINIVLRVIRGEPIPLESLGGPAVLKSFAENGKGLIIITGPTGSGKTTTLSSIVDHINATRSCHIMTIEDPIEYVFRKKRSVVSQREVGTNLKTFSDGLEGAMRQRPDVIAVGELLDRDTVDTLFRAADSGHMVLATTHGRSAKDVINRLLGFFSPDEREQRRQVLASCLSGVVSQALVPSFDKQSWVLASEVFVNNKSTQQILAKGDLNHLPNAMQQGRSDGMYLLNDDLSRLVRDKKISAQQARIAAYEDGGNF